MVHMENNIATGKVDTIRGMITQNTLGRTFPPNPTFGGNVWLAEPHSGIDFDNIGPGSQATNAVELGEDLGIGTEWWEEEVTVRGEGWKEWVLGQVGTGGMTGTIKVTHRQLRYQGPGAPDQYVEFDKGVLKPGRYQVYVYFNHDGDNPAKNVPVTVWHEHGETTVRLDQSKQFEHVNARDHGYLVGVFDFGRGQGRVRIGTHEAAGDVYIRGVVLTRRKIFFADNDSSDVRLVGEWDRRDAEYAHYGANYLATHPRRGRASVTYPFSGLLERGKYDLYFWHRIGSKVASRKMPVIVHHADKTDTVYVDLQADGNRWRHLGRFVFDAGDGQWVRVTNEGTDNWIIADALKLVRCPTKDE
jgi:hypothetical protein